MGKMHKRMGVAVMILGWVQPLNALIRPHAPKTDSNTGKKVKRTKLRLAWEILHKATGFTAIILAEITIFAGIKLIEMLGTIEGKTWRNAYIGTVIALAVIAAAGITFALVQRRRTKPMHNTSEESRGSAYVEETTDKVEAPGA